MFIYSIFYPHHHQVFNQLIITAGSVLAAKNQELTLEPRIILRELFFYSLSVLILCAVVAYRKEGDNDSVRITIIDGISLLGTYIFYVVVCAKFEDIIRFMNMSKMDDSVGVFSQGLNELKSVEITTHQVRDLAGLNLVLLPIVVKY